MLGKLENKPGMPKNAAEWQKGGNVDLDGRGIKRSIKILEDTGRGATPTERRVVQITKFVESH